MPEEKQWSRMLQRMLADDLGKFVPVLVSLLIIWTFFALTEPAFLSAVGYWDS